MNEIMAGRQIRRQSGSPALRGFSSEGHKWAVSSKMRWGRGEEDEGRLRLRQQGLFAILNNRRTSALEKGGERDDATIR